MTEEHRYPYRYERTAVVSELRERFEDLRAAERAAREAHDRRAEREDAELRGVGMYQAMRAFQMRRTRLPKPKVDRGAKV